MIQTQTATTGFQGVDCTQVLELQSIIDPALALYRTACLYAGPGIQVLLTAWIINNSSLLTG